MKMLVVLLMLSMTACGFEVVDTGYRGIEVRYGEVVGEPLPEGLHFYSPFTTDIKEMSVREFNYSTDTESFTKDNQAVGMTVELVWSIDPASVGKVYRDVGFEDAVQSTRVTNNFLSALKDAIGKQDAETIIQNRDKAAGMALAETRTKLAPLGIIAHSLSFTNLSLNKGYQHAVEEKMIAKQLAEKAKNETVQIQEEARQTVVTAQAAAEAMRIKSQALAQNKGLVEFEAVQKWDGKLPQIQFGGNATPFINMDKIVNR